MQTDPLSSHLIGFNTEDRVQIRNVLGLEVFGIFDCSPTFHRRVSCQQESLWQGLSGVFCRWPEMPPTLRRHSCSRKHHAFVSEFSCGQTKRCLCIVNGFDRGHMLHMTAKPFYICWCKEIRPNGSTSGCHNSWRNTGFQFTMARGTFRALLLFCFLKCSFIWGTF
jgi:hypothetical protein